MPMFVLLGGACVHQEKEPDNTDKVVELMQRMQECGPPPPEIVKVSCVEPPLPEHTLRCPHVVSLYAQDLTCAKLPGCQELSGGVELDEKGMPKGTPGECCIM